jgi:competence protein ComEC
MNTTNSSEKFAVRILKVLGCAAIIAMFLMACSDVSAGNATGDNQPQSVSLDDNNGKAVINADVLSSNNDTTDTKDRLEVHFIDVGQGDATLIKCDGHSLLIDAGDNYKGTTVQLYLKKQNVSKLDAVIWTHPDADHIGGADVITTKFEIGTVYMTSVKSDTKTYEELVNAIKAKGYRTTVPVTGSSFELGSAKVTFLGPVNAYDSDNNNSIVCMVQYGDTKFLFTGDAEEEAENDLVDKYKDLSADVYKVGHHGSKTASTEKLLDLVNPTYAVISCGEGNSYGHPNAKVLNSLRTRKITVFRTDEQGSIIATSDGTNITWNTAPSDSWKAGEPTQNSETNKAAESSVSTATGNYIGNRNNQKLHKSSCSTLPAPKNQVQFDSLDEAQNAGYTKDNQCKRCYPYGK